MATWKLVPDESNSKLDQNEIQGPRGCPFLRVACALHLSRWPVLLLLSDSVEIKAENLRLGLEVPWPMESHLG